MCSAAARYKIIAQYSCEATLALSLASSTSPSLLSIPSNMSSTFSLLSLMPLNKLLNIFLVPPIAPGAIRCCEAIETDIGNDAAKRGRRMRRTFQHLPFLDMGNTKPSHTGRDVLKSTRLGNSLPPDVPQALRQRKKLSSSTLRGG